MARVASVGLFMIGLAVARPGSVGFSRVMLLALLLWNGLSHAEGVTLAAISDINGRYGTVGYHERVSAAIERAVADRVDAVVICGDMVAGQRPSPLLTRGELESMWRAFERTVALPLSEAGIPLLVTPGNHDASRQTPFGLEREIYAEARSRPRPSLEFIDDAGWPFFYAVALDDLMLISLDATEPGSLPPAQRQWLADLLEAHRDRYAHVLVYGHLPLWPLAVGREREILGDPALRDLFVRYRVAAYLSGHHHAYFDGVNAGVRHVGLASLGGGRRLLVGQDVRGPHAMTMVRFNGGELVVETLTGADFSTPVLQKSLPPAVRSPLGTLERAEP